MATLRQFVRDMTSLPVGSSIRDSIENPLAGSGGVSQVLENLLGTVVDEDALISGMDGQLVLGISDGKLVDGEIVSTTLAGTPEGRAVVGYVKEEIINGVVHD